jgi:hemerythrin
MRLKWGTDLETGIRKIDLQHQELIEMINELDHALKSGDDGHALDRLLPRLSGYVLFHFGTEEAMFRGDPALAEHAAAHIREHREFSMRVASFKGGAPGERRENMARLIDYLCNWTVEHIMKTDKDLVRRLNGSGPEYAAAGADHVSSA